MKRYLLLFLCTLMAASTWAQKGTLSGTITDSKTGEGLFGVNIFLDGTNVGTVTDNSGAYKLDLSAGERTILISYVGYNTKTEIVNIQAGAVTQLDAVMEQTSMIGQEVVVSASRRAEKITNAPATISVIGAKALSEQPSFNVDIFTRNLKHYWVCL